MKAIYQRVNGPRHEVHLEATGTSAAQVTTGAIDAAFSFESLGPGRFRLTDGERSWRVCVDRDGRYRHVTIEGEGEARFEREESGRRRRPAAAEGTLSSPMPGKIVKVLVGPGDTVSAGDVLLVVEAMKMEIKIAAPRDGVVKSIACAEGDACDGGQILVELEAEAS